MGILNLKYYEQNLENRKAIWNYYYNNISSRYQKLNFKNAKNISYNFSYFPLVTKSEETLLELITELNKHNVFPRRYFYPSLNTLHYTARESCTKSEQISKCVICLPLYPSLAMGRVKEIVNIINKLPC